MSIMSMLKSKFANLPVHGAQDTRVVYNFHSYIVKLKETGEFARPFWLASEAEAENLIKLATRNGDEVFYLCSCSSDDGNLVFPDKKILLSDKELGNA